jgi:hypothetical protein
MRTKLYIYVCIKRWKKSIIIIILALYFIIIKKNCGYFFFVYMQIDVLMNLKTEFKCQRVSWGFQVKKIVS